MPAGLLLSPTDRAERPGDGALAASLPPAAGSLASPAGTTSGPFGEGPVGAVPFSVMRRPSSGLRLRRFPLIPAPEPPSSRAIPGKMVGAKARPQAPHPLQGPAMASLPCLGRHAYFLPCPLSREYRSRRLPAPPVASDPPPVFPLPDLLCSGASVPLLPGQKIVRSTSIFPAIPAPLCKEK